VECGAMVFTGEYATAHEQVHRGISVAARYEYALVLTPSIVIPQDSYTVGCVLTAQSCEAGNQFWAQMLQANETYTNYGMTILQFGSKAGRKLLLYNIGVGAEIDENTPPNYALYGW